MPISKPFVINLKFSEEEIARIKQEVIEEQRKLLIKQGLSDEQIEAILKSLEREDSNANN